MGQQQGDILLHCEEEKASEFALQAAWNTAHHGAGEGQCGFRMDCLCILARGIILLFLKSIVEKRADINFCLLLYESIASS